MWKADGREREERDRKENATFNQRKLNSPCFLSVALEYEDTKQLHQSVLNTDLFVCCSEPEAHTVIFL